MTLNRLLPISFLIFALLFGCDDPETVAPVVIIPEQGNEDGEPQNPEEEPEEEPQNPEEEPEEMLPPITPECYIIEANYNNEQYVFLQAQLSANDSVLTNDLIGGENIVYVNGVDHTDGYVNTILHNLGEADNEFDDVFTRYTYDSDRRITEVILARGTQDDRFEMTYTYEGEFLKEVNFRVLQYNVFGGFQRRGEVVYYVSNDEFGNVLSWSTQPNGVPSVEFFYNTEIKNPYYRTVTRALEQRGDLFPYIGTISPNVLVRKVDDERGVEYIAEYSEVNQSGYPVRGVIKNISGRNLEININYEYACLPVIL